MVFTLSSRNRCSVLRYILIIRQEPPFLLYPRAVDSINSTGIKSNTFAVIISPGRLRLSYGVLNARYMELDLATVYLRD